VESLQSNNYAANAFVIVDGYWITLARPDHQPIVKSILVGKLSHPGPEVVDAMVYYLDDDTGVEDLSVKEQNSLL
jgi:hypothetical protein